MLSFAPSPTRPTVQLSAQQRLKRQQISLEQALADLLSPVGGPLSENQTLNLTQIDRPLCKDFFRQFATPQTLPPVLPLLLWQNCYYLGCPVSVSDLAIQQIQNQLNAVVQIITIDEISYRKWYRQAHIDFRTVSHSAMVNPLTGELDPEDITELTELSLAQTENQIERVRAIITSALRHRASDIHLEPTSDGLRVRYRIDGILRQVTMLPAEISRKLVVSIKVMCEMDIADSRRPQDGRMAEKYATAELQEQGLDLRVSTLPCVNVPGEPSEKVVLRLLRQQNTFSTIDDLGFTSDTRAIYQRWLAQPQGMVILTGPTGSGKTSTLYTSLQAIAHESVNIVTVEDPVEYVLPGITQTQVNELAGMTFATGLRAILRQDPDVIMLGEIRDHETAETAVRAALTGHLVLTTLHTNDAIGAIPRLKDIGPDPGLVSDALLGVIAQRLARRVCPHCAQSYEPTAAELRSLGLEADSGNWKKGKGCDRCFQSGYLGREAIIELLDVDDTVRELISDGTVPQLQRYLQSVGFASFRQGAIEKVTAGITTLDEIRRVLPYSALSRK